MGSPDIIVVGAGAIGASCAWRLAMSGRRVTLVTDPSAEPASGVAAGMLAPVTEAEFGEELLLKLNLASSEMYPSFIEELGGDTGYIRCGTLMVARDQDDNRVLDELHDFQQKLGLDAERLNGRGARDLEPTLSPRTRGGILVADDHQIDPARLLAAVTDACAKAGVATTQGRVTEIAGWGVRLEGGEELRSETVVLAAGSYSGKIAGLDRPLPVRPVKGQLVHLRARGSVPLPTRNIRGLDVYIVTRADGRMVIGASVEEQGFDKTLTAGAVHDLLRDAYEIVPSVVELEFVGVTAGLRPATPDNAPLIGRLSDNVIVATGHYRNGILLAPVTAASVLELADGKEPAIVAAFDPHRFAREKVS